MSSREDLPKSTGAKKPGKPSENRRDRRGRFEKGAKPGPGRPRKVASGSTAGTERDARNALVEDLEAAARLTLRARELIHVADAWRVIADAHPVDVVRELALQADRDGRFVPEFVRKLTGLSHVLLAHPDPAGFTRVRRGLEQIDVDRDGNADE